MFACLIGETYRPCSISGLGHGFCAYAVFFPSHFHRPHFYLTGNFNFSTELDVGICSVSTTGGSSGK